ncbi:hypothetical protein L596_002732 [Steinernema carpocapsae]|uniref:Major facilitator superfamily associated domain-containing protein n=1 Tax=Steinernema carpocapsae TaxID=34508 RepID=A0A4U8UQK4_STECR|nr:hypothetical protein L596_002732 [Steinernema carpocapsae]
MVKRLLQSVLNWSRANVMARLHLPTLIIIISNFGFTAMISVYGVFYLNVFLNVYKMDATHVTLVQTLFMVWNAINDPIFGYIQDIGCGVKWLMNRRKVVLYMGPLFALSFLLFWFPWGTGGLIASVQLLICLFVFDSLLTLVLSAYCGMMVELSVREKDRLRLVVYGEVLSLIAGSVIYPIDNLSKQQTDFGVFQIFTVVVALVAAVCMLITGLFASDEAAQVKEFSVEITEELCAKQAKLSKEGHTISENKFRAAIQVSWQVIREFEFICVVSGLFFRSLRNVVNEQFLIIFIPILLSPFGYLPLGSTELSLYYVLARSVGGVLFLVLWPVTKKFGPLNINNALAVLTIINCTVALIVGRGFLPYIAVFILVENTLSRCGFYGFYTVFVGEVIDNDMKRHQRKTPMSTVIFTLKALFNKPAEQLGPIIILSMLAWGDYQKKRDGIYSCPNTIPPVHNNETFVDFTTTTTTPPPILTASDCDSLLTTMFYVATIYPLLNAILELAFMVPYEIRRRRRMTEVAQTEVTEKPVVALNV